jgi:hypothetical protein
MSLIVAICLATAKAVVGEEKLLVERTATAITVTGKIKLIFKTEITSLWSLLLLVFPSGVYGVRKMRHPVIPTRAVDQEEAFLIVLR